MRTKSSRCDLCVALPRRTCSETEPRDCTKGHVLASRPQGHLHSTRREHCVPTLTCRATVKWLVLVSRTMLVFMADWTPQRHCR